MAPLALERPALVFIGFMGAGKTTAARAAAEALGVASLDSDAELESALGEPISELFDRQGEAAFREREEGVVRELLERGGVVAIGGGAVESPGVREALREHVCVLCEVSEELAWERSQRSDRPLARDRDEFARRYRARAPLYEELARAVLPERAGELAGPAAPWLAALRRRPGVRLVWGHSATGDYPAAVGAGAIGLLDAVREEAGALPVGGGVHGGAATFAERWFCIADRAAVAGHEALLPQREQTIEVDGGEGSKTLAKAEEVLRSLARAGARRDDGVLAFGGGVVGDLAGFCAATYQRGVALVQLPTTLVAQVDSAYGGKTGVDLPEAKNYVGAYHMPAAVLADPRTLATLPREELSAGFAEVVKTALIAGGPLWERVRGLESLAAEELDEVIFACARVKLAVVAADERDSGRRAVLNLGHTVGHAIEAVTGYGRYRHGEAVALGLLAALRLSGADDLRAEVAGLLERHGLPVRLDPDVATADVVAATGLDKKRTRRGVGFVLLERPGSPVTGQAVATDSLRAAVEELHG